MQNENIIIKKNSTKVDVTKMEELFENSNPYAQPQKRIIRDYIYVPQKRVI